MQTSRPKASVDLRAIAKARIKMLEEMIQKNEATKSQKASKKIDSGDF